MNIQENEFKFSDITRVISQNRMLILLTTFFAVLLTCVYVVLTPQIFQGEALVNIPYGLFDIEKPIVSVAESRVSIDMALKEWKNRNSFDADGKNLAERIDGIMVQSVPGTEARMKITIYLKGSERFDAVFEKVLATLNENKGFIQQSTMDKQKFDANVIALKRGIAAAAKTKENVLKLLAKSANSSFNPIAMDLEINSFERHLVEFESRFLFLRGYTYIDGPNISKNYIDKNLPYHALMGATLGFFTAFFIAFVLENKKGYKI